MPPHPTKEARIRAGASSHTCLRNKIFQWHLNDQHMGESLARIIFKDAPQMSFSFLRNHIQDAYFYSTFSTVGKLLNVYSQAHLCYSELSLCMQQGHIKDQPMEYCLCMLSASVWQLDLRDFLQQVSVEDDLVSVLKPR